MGPRVHVSRGRFLAANDVVNPIERLATLRQTPIRMTIRERPLLGREVGERTMQRLRLIYYSLLLIATALMVSAIANA